MITFNSVIQLLVFLKIHFKWKLDDGKSGEMSMNK